MCPTPRPDGRQQRLGERLVHRQVICIADLPHGSHTRPSLKDEKSGFGRDSTREPRGRLRKRASGGRCDARRLACSPAGASPGGGVGSPDTRFGLYWVHYWVQNAGSSRYTRGMTSLRITSICRDFNGHELTAQDAKAPLVMKGSAVRIRSTAWVSPRSSALERNAPTPPRNRFWAHGLEDGRIHVGTYTLP